MMLSRAMSQRSVVIRPATQDTGGMMQYLLTIVFLVVVFWVCVFVYMQFFAAKELLIDSTIYCSVVHRKAINLSVFLPEGVCHVFVALGLISSDGTVHEGYAVSVERLRAVDPKALAFVSIDYAVLTATKDRFKTSLEKFVNTYNNQFWRDRFQGFEIRGVPLADYLDDNKMAALNAIIGEVKTQVAKIDRVIATLVLPASGVPAVIKESTSVPNLNKVIVQTHYLPELSASCTVRPANNPNRMEEVANATHLWSRRPCPSILLGGLFFGGATKEKATASSCELAHLCKARPRDTPAGSETANRVSLIRRVSSNSYIYDTETKIKAKARKGKVAGCLYVDHIELDDANCTCQDRDQFPLLSSVRKGMA